MVAGQGREAGPVGFWAWVSYLKPYVLLGAFSGTLITVAILLLNAEQQEMLMEHDIKIADQVGAEHTKDEVFDLGENGVTCVDLDYNWGKEYIEYIKNQGGADKLLIFMHIPKTGGTTFRHIMANDARERGLTSAWYKNEESVEDIGSVQHLYGHFSWRSTIHEKLLGDPENSELENYNFVTFLREPVDRTLSAYYAQQYLANQEGEKFKATLLQYAKSSANAQAKLLSDRHVKKTDVAGLKDRLSKFAFVGVTERYDESLLVLKYHFLLNNITYIKRKVMSSRPTASDLLPETAKEIQGYNYVDVELYKYANEMLDQNIKAIGKDCFNASMKRLKQKLKAIDQECDEEDHSITDEPIGCLEFEDDFEMEENEGLFSDEGNEYFEEYGNYYYDDFVY